MRWYIGAAVLSASALALVACGKKEGGKAEGGLSVEKAAPQNPAEVAAPQRKPGLWKITTTAAGVTQTMRLCTDAATEAKFSVWGGQASKDMCSHQDMKRALSGDIEFTSTCDMGSGGKTTTTGTISGDFNKSYTVSATTVTEGAGAPQMNGKREMTMQADWQGPCPSDFKPGDMEVAEGMKFNILEMSAMKAAGQ
ncbi:DUF3617 domain-containing protein [Phenylobacterium sp.]|uniref:DUF3617 domain-containing protein n=1 Tax=Phenylobacterium sp. TaxID=1871053 RepID=UPI0035B021D6